MKNSAALFLLSLCLSPLASAKVVSHVAVRFAELPGTPASAELIETADTEFLTLRIEIGDEATLFPKLVARPTPEAHASLAPSAASLEPLKAGGFLLKQTNGGMDEWLAQTDLNLQVELLHGEYVVQSEFTEDQADHHGYGEAAWDNKTSIDYKTKNVSIDNDGDDTRNHEVRRSARMPQTCSAPTLAEYEKSATPKCAESVFNGLDK